MSTRPITDAIIKDVLGYEPLQAAVLDLGGLSGAQGADLAGARNALVRITAEGDLVLAFDGVTAGAMWILELTQDATGGRGAAFAGVTWPSGPPALLRLPNAVNVVSFYSPDGTAIQGFPATTAAPPHPGWSPSRLENMSRLSATFGVPLSLGTVRFTSLTPTEDRLITKIITASRGTVASGATLAKMALFARDGDDYSCLARTANDTTLWTVNDVYPRDIVDDGQGNPIEELHIYAGQTYMIAALQVGGTAATLIGTALAVNAFAALSPRQAAQSGGSQTDIANSYILGSANSNIAWGAVA